MCKINLYLFLSLAESSKMKAATQGHRKKMKVKRQLDLEKKLGEEHEMSGLGCANFAGKQIIAVKEDTTLDRAKSLKTCNPSFHVVMRQSYVEASSHHLVC